MHLQTSQPFPFKDVITLIKIKYVCAREVGENVNVRGWWSTIHREVKKKEQAGRSGFAVSPAVMVWKTLIIFTINS